MLGKTYAIIILDESKRVASNESHRVTLEMRTSEDVISHNIYARRENHSRVRRVEYSSRGNDVSKVEYNVGREKKKVNWNLFCNHCKMY